MVFGRIGVRRHSAQILRKLRYALRWAEQVDYTDLKTGQQIALGSDTIATVHHYTTLPAVKLPFKGHRRRVEIHVVVAGEERVEIGEIENFVVVGDYDPQTDIQRYEELAATGFLILRPGDYIIFSPADVYKAGCTVVGPCRMIKLNIQVSLD